MRLAVRAREAPVATGMEGLVGEVGTVSRELDPEGSVRVHGEIWNAASVSGRVERGERVRVVGVHGMTLSVEGHQSFPRKD